MFIKIIQKLILPFFVFISIITLAFLFCHNRVSSYNKNTINSTPSTIIATPTELIKKATIKEFFTHAIEPLGTTLYIFGGGWAYDDECGDENSMTHGVAKSWKEFFDSQNEWFVYKNSKKKDTSYFPFDGKNTHHEKGLDCTGYLGWILYNTLVKDNSKTNYVFTTSKLFDNYVNNLHLGTQEIPTGTNKEKAKSLNPSDLVIIAGHVYIVVGKCSDDSIVILHSSVSNSITGAYGGGVQLSAINVSDSENKNCEAYRLADYYMTTYYPEWHKRYPTVVKPTYKYLNFVDKDNRFGIFHFDQENILTDPDDFYSKSADEILNYYFIQPIT